MRNSNIVESDIPLIADVIANFHDWASEDLVIEGSNCIATACPNLNPESVNTLLRLFLNLPATVRFAPQFDHEKFVMEHFAEFDDPDQKHRQ